MANHVSYLDILALSVAFPCVFVSKRQVADWPAFGLFARMPGSVFVDRERRGAVGQAAEKMREILGQGICVALFPEGTSSGGSGLLSFKPSLFEPVAALGCPLTPAALRYELADGSVREEIHWWGDASLTPHLLNMCGKKRIDATVVFGEPLRRAGDRKTIARELHGEVTALRAAG